MNGQTAEERALHDVLMEWLGDGCPPMDTDLLKNIFNGMSNILTAKNEALMRIRDLAAIEPRRYDDAGTRMAQIEALANAALKGETQ